MSTSLERNGPTETTTDMQPSVHRRVAVSTAIVMTSILLSRVLGFVREWIDPEVKKHLELRD